MCGLPGGQVTISGKVGRNLTVAGGQVELAPSAVVRGGLVAAGGNVDLSAPVTGAVKAAAGTLIVANRVGGNIDAAAGTLRIASKADVQGDVNYWSGRGSLAKRRGAYQWENRPKRPAKEAAAFSGGVLRMAWFRVNQFCLHVDPGPALGAFSAEIPPIRGHRA